MKDQERPSSSEHTFEYAEGELRKRLEDFGSRIRKKCIRRKTPVSETASSDASPSEESRLQNSLSITQRFVEIMYFGTPEDQIRGVKFIRKLLSSPQPLINEVMQAGLLPILVYLLKSESDIMQYEAAWSLTNIVSGSSIHVRYVIEAGAVINFIKLLSSSNEDVIEQCAWALGNIAGDMEDFRQYVLDKGALAALLKMMENTKCLRLLQTGAWAVCNLCAGKFDVKKSAFAIPIIGTFLEHENLDIIYNCVLALAHISDTKDSIQTIINSNIIVPVIKLMITEDDCLLPHLLKITTNISKGTEKQIDALLKYDILQPLRRNLDSRKETYRHKAFTIVANITGGSTEQIDYVVKNTFTMTKILNSIGIDSERTVKKAIFTLRNISLKGTEEQISLLVDKCVIGKLSFVLTIPNKSIILASLLCLESLLEQGEQKLKKEGAFNEVALTIEAVGGLEKIEELQSHCDSEVYHKAYDIMEKYFSTEEIKIMERPKF